MTHAPKFWAAKLPQERQGEFWGLIEVGFCGETAYWRVLDVLQLHEQQDAELDEQEDAEADARNDDARNA